ncbi:MAG TPA: hypothetical protein PLD73_09735, partial [Candidatus Hydrogenedentes bacterium]|nr:hypothetical protein [Candidatus Hydrogenedentota bacterium]
MDFRTDEVLSPSNEALQRVPSRLAVRYGIVPLAIEDDGGLLVAIEDTEAYDVLDELRMVIGCPVRARLAEGSRLKRAMREHYGIGADTLEV